MPDIEIFLQDGQDKNMIGAEKGRIKMKHEYKHRLSQIPMPRRQYLVDAGCGRRTAP
jgi:hypothetical protein